MIKMALLLICCSDAYLKAGAVVNALAGCVDLHYKWRAMSGYQKGEDWRVINVC